ncbi:helix-turn-helix domain-containing protein [Heyndrickxia camelliae]|uniref:AraC family transcriptional regulator n=1 Tax=Heyndrickxia camelliae TaxID=1707093 RepID=A0A2N3LL87_9BACI|nr:AraC family transcriptional regulator [Heyndrickxia camelliae]PKR85391.1 AraC family transcriptional regulator [Heyndrickxia camelliae]
MTEHPRIKIPDGFWAGLYQLGVTAQAVARKAKLPLTVITESVVTTEQYFAIWQAFSDLVGNMEAAIIKLPKVFEPSHYPPSVLAAYHARDYRDALNRMARYKEMCPPENIRIVEEGGSCIIEVEWSDTDQPGPPLLVGTTLAFLLELGRRGTGVPLKASLVEFKHTMNPVQGMEDYFGCPIQIGEKCNRLTLHREDLDRPFVSYNAELLDILTPILNQTLDEQRRRHSMTEIVKWILKRSLTGDRVEIQNVASELRMSERTLQRRLNDEQTSFKQLLKEARHELAREYLSNLYLDIKEVAFLVGYKDQSSFYRAFRGWEGITPLNWRAEYVNINSIN